ncbi:MAG: hypothetical protein IJ875_04040, partial [Solobacterium sp.]|nr:hypothetical protein [Solobacterium sp.]
MQNKQTFTDRLARSYFMLVGIILFLSFLVFYNTLVMRTSEGISNTIYSYAVELSKAKEVQDIFLEGNVNQRQSDYFKDIIEREKYVDYIVLANKQSIRLFHPDINLIGEKFMGGDEENALLGKEPYISEEKGTSEYQRRCFSPVFDDNHEVMGFVMVSCYTRRISSMYHDELMRFLGLFILSLLVGWGFSYLYARGLKKRLLGYEPAHIAELFIQREDVLNALNEGLILLDNQGKLVYFNGTAFSLLAAGEAYEEKDMEKMIQETIAEKDYQNSVE